MARLPVTPLRVTFLVAAIGVGALRGWELVDTGGPGAATTTIAAAGNGASSRRPSLSVSGEQ